MEKRKSILDYLAQILFIFGFTMVCMMCLAFLFGESAKEYSVFFAFGKEGISTKIMAQFLLLSVLVVLWQILYEKQRFMKFIPTFLRGGVMVLAVLITTSLFIILFQWFPIFMWQPWAMFFICFFVCVIGSMLISITKTNIENRKLEEGLSKLKEQWKKEEENESDFNRGH